MQETEDVLIRVSNKTCERIESLGKQIACALDNKEGIQSLKPVLEEPLSPRTLSHDQVIDFLLYCMDRALAMKKEEAPPKT